MGHEDSHVQATLSVQISGTKRWRLMPLRRRKAPFLAMPLGKFESNVLGIHAHVFEDVVFRKIGILPPNHQF